MVCKKINEKFPDVSMKLLLVGSELEVSRDLALNFVEPEYYRECPQLSDNYIDNLKKKISDCILATKDYEHDLVFLCNSDDFINYEFFEKAINIAKQNPNQEQAFCNGSYDEKEKLGGFFLIKIDENNNKFEDGILIKKCNMQEIKINPNYSQSAGSYGFTKQLLVKLKYNPGYHEKNIERRVDRLKIKKSMIRCKFYIFKSDKGITFSSYNAYKNDTGNGNIYGKFPDDEIQEFDFFFQNLINNVPEKLQYLFNFTK